MALINDLKDEWTELANARSRWEKYWRAVSAWVLPQTEEFDRIVNLGAADAVMAVTGTPVAAERSKDIYDMTSLWAIDRLTSGLISLKTPESDIWHDLERDDDYGGEQSHDEAIAMEKLRDYLFRMRANPKSSFWPSHKAAIKSMCAFGDGWLFVGEQMGRRVPWLYEFIPLIEQYPAMGTDGMPNRNFRVFNWSAYQIASKFKERASKKIIDMANDPKQRHHRARIMHAVRPRGDEYRNRMGVAGAQFASWYCLPDDDHVLDEGGYFEFPFIRYAWSNIGNRPYSEGPVAYALAEIQSLNEMAKNELLAAQMLLRPPLALHGKNFTRINFNPGAPNPGLINGDGHPLFAALNGGVRPDFSEAIMERRRNGLREALYINLWQVLIQTKDGRPETATEAMLRAQEKGEMLGPVGISVNGGLASLVDREVGILNRKGAFRAESPLAMPDSMDKANVAPAFTSPLDRLRKIGQVIGVQRTIEFATALEPVKPGIIQRIDADAALELAQDVYGAPAKILKSREVSEAAQAQQKQLADAANTIAATQQTGEAVRSVGEGAQAAAAGAEAVTASPAAQRIMQAIAQRQQQQRPQLPRQAA